MLEFQPLRERRLGCGAIALAPSVEAQRRGFKTDFFGSLRWAFLANPALS